MQETGKSTPLEHFLSVEEAIREAMETPQSRSSLVEKPPDIPPPPDSDWPLRQASPEKVLGKRPAPKPLWMSSEHEVRGFNPSPVQPLPHMDNVTASSEHAFAAKDESKKRPFKPPLGVQAVKHGLELQTEDLERPNSSQVDGDVGLPPPSPLLTPPASPRKPKPRLRSSRSVGEGLKGLKYRFSSPHRAKAKLPVNEEIRSSVPLPPTMPAAEVRDSFRSAVTGSRSAVTSNSSALHTDSIHTEHSSLTATSSHTSDFVQVYPDWPDTTEEVDTDNDMTVEDLIGIYGDGFESSARPSMETEGRRSALARRSLQETASLQRRKSHDDEPSPQTSRPISRQSSARPSSQPTEEPDTTIRPKLAHRRSQSASLLDRVQKSATDGLLTVPSKNHKHTFSTILANPAGQQSISAATRTSMQNSEVPRDRYGFKKAGMYITAEQYDDWNTQYSEHLERRRKKWYLLMKSYGLDTQQPYRFPPKSDKIKRFVRKGIPPEFRGAAWFWYAGGPNKLAKEPGLYYEALERAKNGKLSDGDKDLIERDLNRTFPDNVRFKPDPSTMMDAQAGAGGGGGGCEDDDVKKKGRSSTEIETRIVKALRRVLQAFAVHNPNIGYCQSLNFIAGLLLLFLDQDEEKAFTLLNIVTTTHLPGTHGVALEGANIDIAVLMSCVKDSIPAVWAKLDDNGGAQLAQSMFPGAEALRLPTVSLATTAWFMSLFVGTLPIESVLRIWDCLFFEGSKTLFRIALAIFKFGEKQILAVSDPMEIFQVVQTIPRSMLDINGLMDVCFRRRGGFAHVSQGLIESRREERRKAVRDGVASFKEDRIGWRGRWRAKTRV